MLGMHPDSPGSSPPASHTISLHIRMEGCSHTHRRAVLIVSPVVSAERSHSDCHTPTQGRCRPARKQPCTHLGTQSRRHKNTDHPRGCGCPMSRSQLFSECVILIKKPINNARFCPWGSLFRTHVRHESPVPNQC